LLGLGLRLEKRLANRQIKKYNNMKKFIVIVFVAAFTALLFASCEEWTPEYKIISSWKLNRVYLNDQEITTDSTNRVYANCSGAFYTFFSDPIMEVTTLVNGMARDSFRGNYSLEKKGRKKTLHVDFLLVDRIYKYSANIEKLTTAELKYTYKDEEGNRWRLEFSNYYQ
jgi:hypothetical protein